MIKAHVARQTATKFFNEEAAKSDGEMANRLYKVSDMFSDLTDEQVEKFVDILQSVNFK